MVLIILHLLRCIEMYKLLICINFNLIRPRLVEIDNDFGRGASKVPPPLTYDLENYCTNLTISYMCILLGVLNMFQSDFFKNSRFHENSCKNDIFVILSETDFKYTKRCRIVMRP